MDWKQVIKQVAPTVATALGTPLAGAAVAAIGSIIGLGDATQDDIAKIISQGKLTPDQLSQLKQLELQYQNEEAERGFKYAELAYKDRDSARNANVNGGTQARLFWLSVALLVITLGTEVAVLFVGYPTQLDPIIVGRVLGLMDAVAMMVLAYWYGTTNGSLVKNEVMAQASKR